MEAIHFEDFEIRRAPGEFVETDRRICACRGPRVVAEGDSAEDTIDCFHAWLDVESVVFLCFTYKACRHGRGTLEKGT